MVFTKYPESLRKHIYTTNSVESINSLVEKIRIRSDGYFNSVEVLEINIYLQRENLRRTKWKKAVPMINAHIYEIQQIFQLRYFNHTIFKISVLINSYLHYFSNYGIIILTKLK
jgi:transposase-like protein